MAPIPQFSWYDDWTGVQDATEMETTAVDGYIYSDRPTLELPTYEMLPLPEMPDMPNVAQAPDEPNYWLWILVSFFCIFVLAVCIKRIVDQCFK